MTTLDLHVGVHKTATTFLQTALQANIKQINGNGVAIPGHRQTRKFVTIPCQLKAYEQLGQKWKTTYADDELHFIINSFFNSIEEKGIKHILLTDENLLGHAGHVVRSGILYSRKEAFLKTLDQFLPIKPQRIFLSYRAYPSFFSSLYGQFLLDVTEEFFVSPEDFAAKVMRRYPNWMRYLQKIEGCFPKSELVIWPYEDVRENWPLVFSAMLGDALPKTLKVDKRSDKRRGLSGRSFQEFKKVLERDGPGKALADLRDLRNKHDDDRSIPFNIFSDDQTLELNRRFEKHIREINKKMSVTTLF